MDADEIGMIVALATDRRHKLREMYGWDLLEPALVEAADMSAAIKLNQLIRHLQKDSNQVTAAALMVWLHTLRASMSLDLRSAGRELWGQLERGFPYALDAEDGFVAMGGNELNLGGYDQFPAGLTPIPR